MLHQTENKYIQYNNLYTFSRIQYNNLWNELKLQVNSIYFLMLFHDPFNDYLNYKKFEFEVKWIQFM